MGLIRHLPLAACCLLLGCEPPKAPAPPPGPALVVFRPWAVSSDGKTMPPAAAVTELTAAMKEIFGAEGVLFEEEALLRAKRDSPCSDLPCAAKVARELGAEWFVVGQIRSFPPAHCFAFFSARSFKTGAELVGYDPSEVDTKDISIDRAAFSLKGKNLKRCDDPAFFEKTRAILQKLTKEPGFPTAAPAP